MSMPDQSGVNWGLLQSGNQLSQIQNSSPQAPPPAPIPEAPSPLNTNNQSGSQGIPGLMEESQRTGGLLSKIFGTNPVQQTNQAISSTLSATHPSAIAQGVLTAPGAPPGPLDNTVKGLSQGIPQGQSQLQLPQTQPLAAPQATTSLIKGFEGYTPKAAWDVNAYRAGYGSDTTTDSNGHIHKITPGMTVTQEDAERDLQRRTLDFQHVAQQQVGTTVWNKLPLNAQSALTSVAYNYGSLPKSIIPSVLTGDPQQISAAVKNLSGDNHGINSDRRIAESKYILSSDQQTNTQTHIANLNAIQMQTQKGDYNSAVTMAKTLPSAILPGSVPIPQSIKESQGFQQGYTAYKTAQTQGITKSPYLVNIDYSQPATANRLSVVNMETGQMVFQSPVSQGAPGFSNTPGSHQSSLGTFITTQPYSGKNGESLRIKGLNPGVNDNVEARDIVVHGGAYAGPGHSFGCFVVPQAQAPFLINLIKDGTIIQASNGLQNQNTPIELSGGQHSNAGTPQQPLLAPQPTNQSAGIVPVLRKITAVVSPTTNTPSNLQGARYINGRYQKFGLL